MKPRHAALAVLLASLTAASLRAAQKHAPPQPDASPLKTAAEYTGIFITATLGAGLGAYLGSYLKKKGENLATQEDIRKLTQATKEIEAKISTETWDRQKRWELKRDILFEAAKRSSELDDALIAWGAKLEHHNAQAAWFGANAQRFVNATAACTETLARASVLCSIETWKALHHFASLANTIGVQITDKNIEAWNNGSTELAEAFADAIAAIKKELGSEPNDGKGERLGIIVQPDSPKPVPNVEAKMTDEVEPYRPIG
jgi:flagellar motor protein MotB